MNDDAADRLTAWAGCVQRLIAKAPLEAVINETGIVWYGHSTPPERVALRKQASATVARWLERDLAALRAEGDTPNEWCGQIKPGTDLRCMRIVGHHEPHQNTTLPVVESEWKQDGYLEGETE